MTHLSWPTRLRHLLIASRWQRWLFPVLCIVPYVGILVWLLTRGLIWVVSGVAGASAHGSSSCPDDVVFGSSRVQNPFTEKVKSLKPKSFVCAAPYPSLDACDLCWSRPARSVGLVLAFGT